MEACWNQFAQTDVNPHVRICYPGSHQFILHVKEFRTWIRCSLGFQPGYSFILCNQNCVFLFLSSILLLCFWLPGSGSAIFFLPTVIFGLKTSVPFFIILSVVYASFYFSLWLFFSELSAFSLTGQPQSSSVLFHCFLKVNFVFMLNLFVPSPYILHLVLLNNRQLVVNQCHVSQSAVSFPSNWPPDQQISSCTWADTTGWTAGEESGQ